MNVHPKLNIQIESNRWKLFIFIPPKYQSYVIVLTQKIYVPELESTTWAMAMGNCSLRVIIIQASDLYGTYNIP